MCLIKSQGKLIFDPIPKSGKIEKLYKPYWAIISIENDVDKYYRWFLQKEKGLILQAPAWGPHVTVCDGERVDDELWNEVKQKYNNQVIDFEHEIFIKSNSIHWWLKVYCSEVITIRNELGINNNLKWSLHLTLGIPIPRHEEHSKYIYKLEMM